MSPIGFLRPFRLWTSRQMRKSSESNVPKGHGWFGRAPILARRLMPFIAAGLLAASAEAAVPSVSDGAAIRTCPSGGVLDEIYHNHREAFERILNDASKAENGEAVLWRIEKDGVRPSHLFGTVHVIDPNVQELSHAVLAAMDGAKVVALESSEASRRSVSFAMNEATQLMISRDRELERLLTEDEFEVVQKAFMDAGYPSDMAFSLRPWAVTMFLADSDCQKKMQSMGLKSLDGLILDRAKANGQPVEGLESVVEQYRALAAIPANVQLAWLKANIALRDRVDDITETLLERYRFRRLSAVWPLTQSLAPGVGLADPTLLSLQTELVSNRNESMLERALPLIEQGDAFIAVGALHEAGAKGLVALLREKGFTVTPVE